MLAFVCVFSFLENSRETETERSSFYIIDFLFRFSFFRPYRCASLSSLCVYYPEGTHTHTHTNTERKARPLSRRRAPLSFATSLLSHMLVFFFCSFFFFCFVLYYGPTVRCVIFWFQFGFVRAACPRGAGGPNFSLPLKRKRKNEQKNEVKSPRHYEIPHISSMP